MKPFTEKVREHRGQLGLSQQELADKAGIGVRTLTYYECGKRFPQAAQLYKLAKAVITDRESAAQLHASELADYIPRVLDFLSLYRGSTLRKDLVS